MDAVSVPTSKSAVIHNSQRSFLSTDSHLIQSTVFEGIQPSNNQLLHPTLVNPIHSTDNNVPPTISQLIPQPQPVLSTSSAAGNQSLPLIETVLFRLLVSPLR